MEEDRACRKGPDSDLHAPSSESPTSNRAEKEDPHPAVEAGVWLVAGPAAARGAAEVVEVVRKAHKYAGTGFVAPVPEVGWDRTWQVI